VNTPRIARMKKGALPNVPFCDLSGLGFDGAAPRIAIGLRTRNPFGSSHFEIGRSAGCTADIIQTCGDQTASMTS
jgi:hypothetical protein